MSYNNDEETMDELSSAMLSDDDGTSNIDLDEPLEPLETTETFDDYVEEDPDSDH